MDTATELVARGAALLDERVPDWVDRINTDSLAMDSLFECVLGQVARADDRVGNDASYGDGLGLVGLTYSSAQVYGFERSLGTTYDDLDAAWRDLIDARRRG